jgi:hypothetical protein
MAAVAAPPPAAPFSPRDADQLAAAARANPRDADNQATVDLSIRLGKARSLEALDYMLQLRHAGMVSLWTNGFRGVNGGRPAPAVEERVLRIYDDDRLAWALMQALERYESPALGERLLDDVAKLAAIREERARRCRIASVKPLQPTDERMRAIESRRASSQGGIGVMGVNRGQAMPRLQCPPDFPAPVAMSRHEAAVRLVGNTSSPGIVERVTPFIRRLSMSPPIDEHARGPGIQRGVGTVSSLASIARLVATTGYAPAGPELVAALDPLEGTSASDFQAALPILQAISVLDLPEGTRAVARWVELRLVAALPADSVPDPWTFVGLLYGALPQAQIDVGELRDRVLPKVRPEIASRATAAFDGAIVVNRQLRDAKPEALIYWARSGGVRQARYLISRGVNPDTRGPHGETPLTAAFPSAWAMQKFLVESGASPDLAGEGGMTPFYLAVRYFGFNAPVDELYETLDFYRLRGANINSKTAMETPLHAAAARSVDATRYLLRHKAAIEATNARGGTPLHIAVQGGKVDVAEVLLVGGANPNAEMKDTLNLEGYRPLQMALDAKNAPMQALLEKHGASVSYPYLARRAANAAMATLIAPFFAGMH